jgi:uncharacterized membrane protein YkoI
MLQKIFIALGMILTFAFNNACSDDANNPMGSSTITETQAIQKAQLTNSGTVTRTELTTHNGVKVWEIYMTTSTGGELKIKYRVDNGTMVEMKGISPSFEYEVQPGMNLINYSAAKSASLNVKSGQIKNWKLEKNESDNRWEYRFFILASGQEWEIRIDASSGVLLRIK